jgi:hypothetical protein
MYAEQKFGGDQRAKLRRVTLEKPLDKPLDNSSDHRVNEANIVGDVAE